MLIPNRVRRRALALPIAAVLAALPSTAAAAPPVPQTRTALAFGDNLLVRQAVFMSTHNSYSGDLGGMHRGTIEQQLNNWVRFLEFDVYNNEYAKHHDFRIGHWGPDSEVYKEGTNPRTALLTPWLNQVRSWSDNNPGHAPITVMLDLKSNISAVVNSADGNLSTLNQKVTAAFEDKLVWAEGRETEPGRVGELRNKIMVVLSGNQTSRVSYLRDTGVGPAVSVNTKGQVVQVHADRDNNLWYWTGQVRAADKKIEWRAHGRYDKGRNPAVALRPDGLLIEVHRSQNFANLYYHVGEILPSGQISWGPSTRYQSSAEDPTIRLDPPRANAFLEIDTPVGGTQRYARVMTLDPAKRTVTLGGQSPTSERISKTTSIVAGQPEVRVYTRGDDRFPADTLRYTLRNPDGSGRITYRQVMYAEQQASDSVADTSQQYFFGAPVGDTTALRSAHAAQKATRGWQFRSPANDAIPWYVNFPATDYPDERELRAYLYRTRAWVH
ncbi:hypothetical protein Cme02nite_65110 [Catellatospora methionotrophica]|uniref:Uncharacterized protein n=1 Tax=Catellatospora methionotrophica TaxID=121620 RepID=A0A8J3LG25_9ACTN|nr:hypothetical protein [Catellatospora methionotrophica]GIG18179.1 hypothetical protein Cme02nite_65110 [Catellatospora methionotrophica]